MKRLPILTLLTLIIVTPLFAQWKSENPDYLDDLPFDSEGNLVFKEVVEIYGNKEELWNKARLYQFTELPELDALVIKKPDLSNIDNELGAVSLVAEESDDNSLVFACKRMTIYKAVWGPKYFYAFGKYKLHLQIKDGKYRYIVEILDISYWDKDREIVKPASELFKKNFFKTISEKEREKVKQTAMELISLASTSIKKYMGTPLASIPVKNRKIDKADLVAKIAANLDSKHLLVPEIEDDEKGIYVYEGIYDRLDVKPFRGSDREYDLEIHFFIGFTFHESLCQYFVEGEYIKVTRYSDGKLLDFYSHQPALMDKRFPDFQAQLMAHLKKSLSSLQTVEKPADAPKPKAVLKKDDDF